MTSRRHQNAVRFALRIYIGAGGNLSYLSYLLVFFASTCVANQMRHFRIQLLAYGTAHRMYQIHKARLKLLMEFYYMNRGNSLLF